MANLYKRIVTCTNGMHTSGANMLGLVWEAVCEFDTADVKDWTNLAHCVGKQKNSGDRKKIAAILKAATGGVFVVDKKQPSGYRLKKDTMVVSGANSGENRAQLEAYVVAGVSFRNGLDELLAKEAAKYVLATAVTASVRRADKELYSRAEFMKVAADAWDAIIEADTIDKAA